MLEREIKIYNLLFNQIRSKQELADFFNVTTKTIENSIKKCDDIVYSKKLGGYHFKDLLPKYISFQNYFTLFKDSISNNIIKKDFINISSTFHTNNNMIDTKLLSILSQKIIKTEIAINHNCILKVKYLGSKKDKEIKYIEPKQIFTNGYTYYLAVIYDKRNKENSGKERQLAFNGIESIEPVEYIKDKSFRSYKQYNPFGSYDNAKKIRLKLLNEASTFFKREGFFETDNFKFLSEISTNEIEIEMKYIYKTEVIKLIQQWLPLIAIIDESDEAQNIKEEIKSNFEKFISLSLAHS